LRAICFDMAEESFPASLVEIPNPSLPRGDWARVKVVAGGICGSDLHLFSPPSMAVSPVVMGAAAFPFVLGHEISGVVVESGANCAFSPGTPVAVDPCLPCRARGIEPVCASCARGWTASCLNLHSKVLTPGRTLGYTSGLGGGWAEEVLAHESMLHPIPTGLRVESAVLHEPISIALHGLGHQMPKDGEPVLVVGAGVVGLCALVALASIVPNSPLVVLARHEHQARAALAIGASRVVSAKGAQAYEELAELVGAKTTGMGEDLMLMGGFPYVIEAVGSPGAITMALRCVESHGSVLMLGAGGIGEVDLTPLWYKEAQLVGSVDHGAGPLSQHLEHLGSTSRSLGPPQTTYTSRSLGPPHSIDIALSILASGKVPFDHLITHSFALEQMRPAIECALDKGPSGSLKVVFHPSFTNS